MATDKFICANPDCEHEFILTYKNVKEIICPKCKSDDICDSDDVENESEHVRKIKASGWDKLEAIIAETYTSDLGRMSSIENLWREIRKEIEEATK